MIIEIIKGTPWWVYLLLILLIHRGINACMSRNIRLQKIFILPVVFFIISVFKITNVPVYVISLVGGTVAGFFLYFNADIKADKVKQLIHVPGSIIPLFLIVFAFAKGYFVGYESAVNPQLLKIPWVSFSIISRH